MYSRFPNRVERNVQIPEHYSGCAFSSSNQPPQEEMRASAPPLPLTPPSTAPSDADSPSLPSQPHESKKEEEPAREVSSALRRTFGGPLSFFPAGMNFEEILLIGLILLLARSEQDNDIILWLVLLLLGK